MSEKNSLAKTVGKFPIGKTVREKDKEEVLQVVSDLLESTLLESMEEVAVFLSKENGFYCVRISPCEETIVFSDDFEKDGVIPKLLPLLVPNRDM